MPDININYKRLKGAAFLSSNRLYKGPDHLLSIGSNFFSEKYSRFYYKDIQSIITRTTSKGKILNVIFALLLILVLIPALMSSGRLSVFFYILAVIVFIPFIINILKGTTSVTYIQSPVQTAKLGALNRVRGNERAITQLKPLIENAQGTLTEDLIAEIRHHEKSEISYEAPQKILKHENGILHLIVFSLLIFTAVFTAVDIFYQNFIFSLINSAAALTMIILLIIALIKQKDSDIYKSIKAMAWSTVGYVCIITFFSYILSFIMTLQDQRVIYSQWELIKKISELSPLSNPWLLGLSVFSFIFSFVIGISGLVLIMKFRQEFESMQETRQPAEKDSSPVEPGHE